MQAIFRLTNLTSVPLDFDFRQAFQAKVEGRWADVKPLPFFGDIVLQAHREQQLHLYLERNTEVCRFLLKCRLPTASEKWDWFLQDHGLSRRFPRLSRWLIDHAGRRIIWRDVVLDVSLTGDRRP